MVEIELKKGIFEYHGMTLRRGIGRAKARSGGPSIAYVRGFRGSDRSRIGVHCGEPFDLARLPSCCSFCLTLSSKRIIALVRAGKNERIRNRIDGDGKLLLLLLLVPLARNFLSVSRVHMSKRIVDLVVRGDVWEPPSRAWRTISISTHCKQRTRGRFRIGRGLGL